MSIGWFKISRTLLDSHLWKEKPFSPGQAWVDLIGLAEYQTMTKDYQGKQHTIKRGEACISKKQLSERWGWYKLKVMRFLDKLENENMIIQISSSYSTIIRIVNYEKYQGSEEQTVIKHEEKRPEKLVVDASISAMVELICSYFGITQMRNIHQYMKTGNFCLMLKRTGRDQDFNQQFEAFKKYKEKSGDKIPSVDSFLGSAEENFNDGKWCCENWTNKLKRVNDNFKPKKSIAGRYSVDSWERPNDRI